MKLTSDGDLTELRTDWHEKSANLKQQHRRSRDDSRVQRLFSEEKASNNTPVENQELVSESAVEKPSYTHLSGNSTLRTIIERWARHKYTTCNGSYPLSKDHHPIYTSSHISVDKAQVWKLRLYFVFQRVTAQGCKKDTYTSTICKRCKRISRGLNNIEKEQTSRS